MTQFVSPALALRPLIQQHALAIRWDPWLLEAQILVESSGDHWAFRPEPAFYTQYIKDNPAWTHRPEGPLAACSYGLLQILFATAVDRGFPGRPEDLFDIQTNLHWGGRHLAYLREHVLDPAGILAAYNGGLNGNTFLPYRSQAYADKVLAQRAQLVPGGPLRA